MVAPLPPELPLLDRLQYLLHANREDCHARSAWVVDPENRVLACDPASASHPNLAPVLRAAAVLHGDGSTNDAGLLIHLQKHTYVIQHLPARYRVFTLVVELRADAVDALPCSEAVQSVNQLARLLARQIGDWMSAADQDRLSRRRPDPVDVGKALFSATTAISQLQIVDETGTSVHLMERNQQRALGETAIDVSGLLKRMDHGGRVAHLGPIFELNWLEGNHGHIVLHLGEPRVLLHLHIAPASAIDAIRGMLDFLLPNRHEAMNTAWLRDHGCQDPGRTSWHFDASAPNGEQLIRSRHGRLFHRPACSQAEAIAPSNRRWLPSRRDGIAKGLRPCRSCGA